MGILQNIFSAVFQGRYETGNLLENYVRSQYGVFLTKGTYSNSESFYQRILAEASPYIKDGMKILDVGCATGRITFELGGSANVHCMGTDYSKNFINFADKLKDSQIPEVNFRVRNRQNIFFAVDDILNTNLQKNSFDFIACVNIFDRVKNPHRLIDAIHALLRDDGILLLVDPYDWAMSPTPKKFQTNDMKEFLSANMWGIKKEIRGIEYTVPIGGGKEKSYNCHVVVARKFKLE